MDRGIMNKVKLLREAGVDFPNAVRASLGCSVADFAAREGLFDNIVSAVINGSAPWPYHRYRDALARALDVDRVWLDSQIEEQRASRQTSPV
jgi:transcriptional regulator with XRE-family HTH domain